MQKEFTVEMYRDPKFSSFNSILEPLPKFKSFLREIKLNTILEGKKVQFQIDEIKSNDWHFMGLLGKPEYDLISITNFSFKVISMDFIIKDDIVESLKVNIDTLKTPKGEILKELLINEIKLDMKATQIKDKIIFYIEHK